MRNRDFTLLWTGQVVSELAAYGTQLALSLLVLGIGGSTAQAGAVSTTAAAASAVARLPGGALVDRVDRRRLLLISDAVRGVVMALVAVAVVTRHVSLWALAGAFAVIALAAVVGSGCSCRRGTTPPSSGDWPPPPPGDLQGRVVSVVFLAATGAAALVLSGVTAVVSLGLRT